VRRLTGMIMSAHGETGEQDDTRDSMDESS